MRQRKKHKKPRNICFFFIREENNENFEKRSFPEWFSKTRNTENPRKKKRTTNKANENLKVTANQYRVVLNCSFAMLSVKIRRHSISHSSANRRWGRSRPGPWRHHAAGDRPAFESPNIQHAASEGRRGVFFEEEWEIEGEANSCVQHFHAVKGNCWTQEYPWFADCNS